MSSVTTIPFWIRGAIVALLFMIAVGFLFGPAGFRPAPQSAKAAFLDEVKKLLASNTEAVDEFGISVAVSGGTAVVGAFLEDELGTDAGAAYVFQRDEGGADNWGEVTKLTASDTDPNDKFGCSVALSGDTAVVGAYIADAGGRTGGAAYAYVFERDQGGANNWGEVKKLTASDSEAGDNFGRSVTVSGNTAIVGARGEDAGGSDAGAAYVFQRDQGGADNWGQVKKLLASDSEEGEEFGQSVALSGDTVVIGALLEDSGGSSAGAAYVFRRDEGGADNWGQVTKLTASDSEAGDRFGVSVAIGGGTAVVGAFFEDAGGVDSGAAYVFERNQGGTNNWGQVRKLTAADAEADDKFGGSVAISGATAVVGAHLEDAGASDAGAAYVVQRDEGGADNWGQVTKLRGSHDQRQDEFGGSVAVSGDTAVVGAPSEDAGGTSAGAAYIFQRDEGGAGNWGEVKELTSSDAQSFGEFGSSVAIDGDTIVVGAEREDVGGNSTGAAYVFRRDEGGGGNWGEVTKLTAAGAQNLDFFGRSVAVSGDTAVVGADGDDVEGSRAGAAYVFQRDQGGADNWGEVRKLTAFDAQATDLFGQSVAISGDTAVVGADGEDTGGSAAGAAYVFRRNQGSADNWGQVKKLTAADAQGGASFGSSVAVSNATAVVGAFSEGARFSGAAYVFEGNEGGSGNWGQVTKLTASDADLEEQFGTSVATNENTIVVGAPFENSGGQDAGAAYVFERDRGGTGNWGEAKKLTASDAQARDEFGGSVAVSGDIVILGAAEEDTNGSGAGAAYVFQQPLVLQTPTPTVTPTPPTEADLVVTSIDISPPKPEAGEPFDFTVEVSNLGLTATGAFSLDFYANLPGPPGPGQTGDFRCNVEGGLAAGASFECSESGSFNNPGSYDMWAQVDTDGQVDEASEDNNVFGPQKLDVNEPGASTSTATSTSTPTSPPTSTPPQTNTPAPTATNTPSSGLLGDVNCNEAVDAIDVALLLQFGAGLLQSLICEENADVNMDGSTNSIDVALILQFIAGLLDDLPP